jgi:hypothetical protein
VEEARAPAGEPAPPMEAEGGATLDSTVFNSGAAVDPAQAIERLVVKNAVLTIVVADPSVSMDNLSRMAEELGGYVVKAALSYSQTESGIEVPRATVVLRVPAERLDEALGRIQAESDRDPLNKTVDSEDVTGAYTDLQSRLRNLEAAEQQLTEIMEQANRTEDVLSVYGQLNQIRGEIEVIKGQIQYYEQSAALSSINVDILANEAVQPLTIGSWEPVGVAKDAVQALISGLKFLATAGLWIVLFFLPMALFILLPLAFVVWLARRVLRLRRKPVAGIPPAASPPAPPAQAV